MYTSRILGYIIVFTAQVLRLGLLKHTKYFAHCVHSTPVCKHTIGALRIWGANVVVKSVSLLPYLTFNILNSIKSYNRI